MNWLRRQRSPSLLPALVAVCHTSLPYAMMEPLIPGA